MTYQDVAPFAACISYQSNRFEVNNSITIQTIRIISDHLLQTKQWSLNGSEIPSQRLRIITPSMDLPHRSTIIMGICISTINSPLPQCTSSNVQVQQENTIARCTVKAIKFMINLATVRFVE